MKIHVCTPYAVDKNLGRAYNEACALVPNGDWICVIDYDVMFLTPDAIKIMYEYVALFPGTGLFTCYTNRIHPMAIDQLIMTEPSDNTDIRHWQNLAKVCAESPTLATKIGHEISGFLMLFSKETWKQINFDESKKCLGVDNDFSLRVLMSGKKIYRMNRLLVWHSYRVNDITDKSHLK